MTQAGPDHAGRAGREPLKQRAVVGELVLRVYDRGPEPEWHADRSLFGPWQRYEAELSTGSASAVGSSPWEAAYRLIAAHRHIAPDTQPQRRNSG